MNTFYNLLFTLTWMMSTAPPVVTLDVNVQDVYGDRFKPIVVDVEYAVNGQVSGHWDYEVSHGTAKRVGNTLYIYGDGYPAPDALVTITAYDQTVTRGYSLRAEPLCAEEERGYDCLGYEYSGDPAGFIWYGAEDTQTVDVEIAIIFLDESDERSGIFRVAEPDWARAQKRIDAYNDYMERSGVHINWVLKDVVYTSKRYDLIPLQRHIDDAELAVDITLGVGWTYADTCGVAYPNRSFRAGRPKTGLSDCTPRTDIHELGHAVGLAHGPENSNYPASGYIWPEFGHGGYDQCVNEDDLMSYGYRKRAFYNSTRTCDEQYGDGSTFPAGDRYRNDAAYHWNRVRYSLSLINDDTSKYTEHALAYVSAEAEPVEELIVCPPDHLDDLYRPHPNTIER